MITWYSIRSGSETRFMNVPDPLGIPRIVTDFFSTAPLLIFMLPIFLFIFSVDGRLKV